MLIYSNGKGLAQQTLASSVPDINGTFRFHYGHFNMRLLLNDDVQWNEPAADGLSTSKRQPPIVLCFDKMSDRERWLEERKGRREDIAAHHRVRKAERGRSLKKWMVTKAFKDICMSLLFSSYFSAPLTISLLGTLAKTYLKSEPALPHFLSGSIKKR